MPTSSLTEKDEDHTLDDVYPKFTLPVGEGDRLNGLTLSFTTNRLRCSTLTRPGEELSEVKQISGPRPSVLSLLDL